MTRQIVVTAVTTTLDDAAMVGSISTVTLLYIWTGSVCSVGDRRNSAMTTSSNDVTKAKTAPVTMPRLINGIVTFRKVRTGGAPSDADARSSFGSKPPSE